MGLPKITGVFKLINQWPKWRRVVWILPQGPLERFNTDYVSSFSRVAMNVTSISPYHLAGLRINSLMTHRESIFDLPVGSALWLTNSKYTALSSISCLVIDNAGLQYRASYQPTPATVRARDRIPAITDTGKVKPGKYQLFVAENCDEANAKLFDTGIAVTVNTD